MFFSPWRVKVVLARLHSFCHHHGLQWRAQRRHSSSVGVRFEHCLAALRLCFDVEYTRPPQQRLPSWFCWLPSHDCKPTRELHTRDCLRISSEQSGVGSHQAAHSEGKLKLLFISHFPGVRRFSRTNAVILHSYHATPASPSPTWSPTVRCKTLSRHSSN